MDSTISKFSDLQTVNRTSSEHVSGKIHSVFIGGQANRNPLGVQALFMTGLFAFKGIV